ncbi:MAG: hypothetical protein ACOYXS_06910 [Chloroflexota bacterium]
MAVAMLVAGSGTAQPVVGPEAAARLAQLGITRVSLLADQSGIGIVLEGWAFDPASVDEAVRVVFPTAQADVRIFHEVEHVAVSVTSQEGSSA